MCSDCPKDFKEGLRKEKPEPQPSRQRQARGTVSKGILILSLCWVKATKRRDSCASSQGPALNRQRPRLLGPLDPNLSSLHLPRFPSPLYREIVLSQAQSQILRRHAQRESNAWPLRRWWTVEKRTQRQPIVTAAEFSIRVLFEGGMTLPRMNGRHILLILSVMVDLAAASAFVLV